MYMCVYICVDYSQYSSRMCVVSTSVSGVATSLNTCKVNTGLAFSICDITVYPTYRSYFDTVYFYIFLRTPY